MPYSVLFQRKVICTEKFRNSDVKQILCANIFYENVISITHIY